MLAFFNDVFLNKDKTRFRFFRFYFFGLGVVDYFFMEKVDDFLNFLIGVLFCVNYFRTREWFRSNYFCLLIYFSCVIIFYK